MFSKVTPEANAKKPSKRWQVESRQNPHRSPVDLHDRCVVGQHSLHRVGCGLLHGAVEGGQVRPTDQNLCIQGSGCLPSQLGRVIVTRCWGSQDLQASSTAWLNDSNSTSTPTQEKSARVKHSLALHQHAHFRMDMQTKPAYSGHSSAAWPGGNAHS